MAPLGDQRLLIVSGKGGVGKSTVSAALGLALSRAGKKTLVCEVNTKERLSALLGLAPAGPQVAPLAENLWAVDVRPQEAMREYGMMILKFKTVYNAVFENRLVRYFLRFIPSLQELTLIGKILFHAREMDERGAPRFDRVIIDAPATGHAISLFSLPQVILDTVPPGPLSKESAAMRDLLVDPAVTAVILVSLPEEMPVNETLDLHEAFSGRVHLKTRAAILNMAVQPRFSGAELNTLRASSELGELATAQATHAALTLESRGRLEAGLGVPVLEVPRLFLPTFGREAIERVAESLQGLWG